MSRRFDTLTLAVQIAAIPAGAATMRQCRPFAYLIDRLMRAGHAPTRYDMLVQIDRLAAPVRLATYGVTE